MRALVFGATGYTGRNVVAELGRSGHAVVAHVRADSPSAEQWSQRFSAWGASAARATWDAAGIARLVQVAQPEVVFALIGTTRKRAKGEGLVSSDIYDSVDRALTSLVIEAALENTPRARVVYLSAVGVTPESANAYLRARARVEQQLRDSQLEFTIARPSFISGPDRDEERVMERVATRVTDALVGALAMFGIRSLSDRYHSMTGSELGRALVAAATDPSYRNKVLGVAELRRLGAERASTAARGSR